MEVESYVLGVSTRRVEGLVRQPGIERISKSRVSQIANELDSEVEAFRTRPLGWSRVHVPLGRNALTEKVREGGRIANVAAVVATGVNAAGNRETLGLDLQTSEDGAGWNAFLRGLVARRLSGVRLMIWPDAAGGPSRGTGSASGKKTGIRLLRGTR